MLLGDLIAAALDSVGVTEARVSRWLGKCCCKERRERLNALHCWARRVLSPGKTDWAAKHLDRLLEDSPDG